MPDPAPSATVPSAPLAAAGRGTPILTDSAPEPELGRLKIRLNRARNLRGPELLSKKDCYVVFTFEKRRVASSVKYGTVAPVWDQDYYLDKVYFPPTSKVAITVVYKGDKKDEVLGVAAPGQHLWTKSTETPVDKWLPIATKDGIYAGELNFHLHWTKLEPEYREVFKSVGSFVGKFRGITRPLYYQIDAAVDSVLLLASMAQKWWSGLTNVQLYSLVAVILALGFVLFLPALIVVPIVLTMTVATGILFGPFLFITGWLLFTSAPVQDRLVKPLLDRALKVDIVRQALTKSLDA